MNIGLQLSSIAPYLQTAESLRESLTRIAAMGYHYVQLQGVPTDVSDQAIVDALAESGLECVATQEDYPLGFAADPDRAIARAVACGAGHLTCALIPREVDSVVALEAFAADLTLIVEKVKQAGLTFSFHPIAPDYRDMDGERVAYRLMDLLPADVELTFCLNAAFNGGADPAEVFARFAGRISLAHFKDDALLPDGTRHMTPLGQGDHDWQPILDQCRQHGVKYVFAEQERWLKDAFESMDDSWRYLSSLK